MAGAFAIRVHFRFMLRSSYFYARRSREDRSNSTRVER